MTELINPIYPRGEHTPPAMYLCISKQIRVRVRLKKLTVPNYKFEKGQYAFYTIKLQTRYLQNDLEP